MDARRVHPTARWHAAPMNTLAMAGLEAEVGVGDHQPHTTQPSLAAGPEELAPEVFIFGVASQFDQSSPLSRPRTDELCAPALRVDHGFASAAVYGPLGARSGRRVPTDDGSVAGTDDQTGLGGEDEVGGDAS